MSQKLFAVILTLGLILPEIILAQQKPAKKTVQSQEDPPAAAQPSQPAAQTETPQSVRPQAPTTAERRSYEREVRGRRHHHRISKKEWIFLGAVAGTSMGIGALAGGAHGLAIGAIVGGWGAFAAHKFYHFIR